MAAKKKSTSTAKRDNRDKLPVTSGVHVNDHVSLLPEGSALVGHFATVEKGDDKGRYGVVERVNEFDSKGWPKTVVFRTRDDESEDLVVNYNDLKRASAGRR